LASKKGVGLIGDGHRQATFVAALALSTSAFTVACALPVSASQRPSGSPVAAATAAPGFSVTFARGGVDSTYVTHAKTVGDFLGEHGILPAAGDSVTPSVDTPLTDGVRIEYRVAVPVYLYVAGKLRSVQSSAADVASLLAEQDVTLGTTDSVSPGLTEPLSSGVTVRVSHETVWTALRREILPAGVVRKYSAALAPGTTKTVFAGSTGERDIMTHFMQRDDEPISAQHIASRIVRKPRPRVVLQGIGEYAAFARLAQRGFDATVGLTRSALRMIATAYTASCYGCSGYAANGMRAGHGVVAVDPALIPLGTHLYIPGYGSAIAGDTGGAIVGHRIDLGFNSLLDALQFGRRAVTVYILR
jgi:3D (Asp-Asp-Asp) domain-containing protein